MKKNNLVILLIVIVFVTMFFVQKQSSLFTKKVEEKLNIADRYAFISDKQTNKMAVIDIYAQKIVSYLQLELIPKKIIVDKTGSKMFYIANGSKKIHVMDLGNQRKNSYELDIIPDDFTLHTETNSIAISQLADPKENIPSSVSLYNLSTMKHINTIKLAAGKPSLIYSIDGLFLFINDEIGHIWKYSFANKKLSEIDIFKNNSLNDIYNPITLSPNGKYAVFSSKTNKKVFLWDIFKNKIKAEFKTLGEPNQPYVSNNGENVIITDNADSTYILDGNSFALKEKIDITSDVGNTKHLMLSGDIKIGWSDNLSVINNGSDLIVIELNQQAYNKELNRNSISAPIVESIVSSDSKTYVGIQNDNKIVFFDIKNKKISSVIKLKKIKQASSIAIGLSNTLCH